MVNLDGENSITVVKRKSSDRARVNEQIREPQVRLIDSDGTQVGVVSIEDAKKRAESVDLDLVEISPNAKPPVCRIMDYGKYLFMQSKKHALAKKKQKLIHIKEIKFRPVTEEGDYQVKLKRLISFLENGDKVKVTLRFRGREVTHQELGYKLLQRVKEDLKDYSDVEVEPKREGRLTMIMILAPLKKKV